MKQETITAADYRKKISINTGGGVGASIQAARAEKLTEVLSPSVTCYVVLPRPEGLVRVLVFNGEYRQTNEGASVTVKGHVLSEHVMTPKAARAFTMEFD